MDDKIRDLFSKHFNRIKTDLLQIKGVTPVMIIVISNGFRNLEDDILNVLENENGLDKDTNNPNNQ
jgi:hypothetical protein